MSKERTIGILALVVLALAATASAQARQAQDCYGDARWAPAWCAQYFESVLKNGEIKKEPNDSRGNRRAERPEEYWDREMSDFLEQVPDGVKDKARDELVDGMKKANPRMRGPIESIGNVNKNIGKVKDIYKIGTDPKGYAGDKVEEKAMEYVLEGGEWVLKNVPRGTAVAGGTAVFLYPEPTSPRAGSTMPENHKEADRAYKGLQQGQCVPRNVLNIAPPPPEAPSMYAGPAGGVAPYPAPAPRPGAAPYVPPHMQCATTEELKDYVSRYDREFEGRAGQEQTSWNASREMMGFMQQAMAEAEAQLRDPNLDPQLRGLLQQGLNDLRLMEGSYWNRGIRPPSGVQMPSTSSPFMKDQIHDAYEQMDSKWSTQWK